MDQNYKNMYDMSYHLFLYKNHIQKIFQLNTGFDIFHHKINIIKCFHNHRKTKHKTFHLFQKECITHRHILHQYNRKALLLVLLGLCTNHHSNL